MRRSFHAEAGRSSVARESDGVSDPRAARGPRRARRAGLGAGQAAGGAGGVAVAPERAGERRSGWRWRCGARRRRPMRRGRCRCMSRGCARRSATRRRSPPRRRATGCGCVPASSTPSASSEVWRPGGARWRPASPSARASCCATALGLWRGPPLAELEFEPFAQVEIARLQEQRLAALEARVDADLAIGPACRADRRAPAACWPSTRRASASPPT